MNPLVDKLPISDKQLSIFKAEINKDSVLVKLQDNVISGLILIIKCKILISPSRLIKVT